LKKHELESLIKSVSIFFFTLSILTTIIVYIYYKEQSRQLQNSVLEQMKVYNLDFKNPDFLMDIVAKTDDKELNKLYINKNALYTYFTMPTVNSSLLKIIYPRKKYETKVSELKFKVLFIYLFVLAVILVFSFFYALYTLAPMKNAYNLLETFLKDIIHDLNTPITSISLNTRLLKKKCSDSAIDRIELSSKFIGTLYKNLEIYIRDLPLEKKEFDLKSLILKRIDYFKQLYPFISIHFTGEEFLINSSEVALTRIIDNLLSNACKYNKAKGEVFIELRKNKLIIRDTGIGIKSPQKVFERFYKETDRGMGLGMSIVKKLCIALNIKIEIESELNIGTKISLIFT
jgi:two-component system OmpR family sensor kinase